MSRIKEFLHRKEKQGFQFTKLPNLEFDPKKARTKQLKMLREYTSKKIMQEKSEWVEPETGEIYKGKQGVKEETLFRKEYGESYQEAVQKYDYQTRETVDDIVDVHIYDQIKQVIEDLPNSGYSHQAKGFTYFEDQKSELLSMLDDLIGTADDVEEVYDYLRRHESEIVNAGKAVAGASDSEEIKESYTHIAIILNNGFALTPEQSERLEEQYPDLADEGEY